MIVAKLTALGTRPHVLIAAAREGRICALECAMPECVCPDGREHFDPRGIRSPWAPSADRWPIPGRDGGLYVTSNVRLAHSRCNKREGTFVTAEHRRSTGQYLSPEHRENGRRLSERGVPALRAWETTPVAHGIRVANGRKLGEWIASHRDSPERAAGASLGGKVSNCKRWQVGRGRPCTCGVHGVTACVAAVHEMTTVS